MGYGDYNDRDLNGNHSSPSYSSDEALRSGANPYDSRSEVERKVYAERTKRIVGSMGDAYQQGGQQGGSVDYSGGGGGSTISGRTLLIVLLTPFVIAGVAAGAVYGRQAFHDMREAMLRNDYIAAADKIATERMQDYGDFSKASDWPAATRSAHERGQGKQLAQLLEGLPDNLNTLSPARRAEIGGDIWFGLAAKGRDAEKYLRDIEDAPHRGKLPSLKAGSLSIQFLRQQCAKGIEVACLDAAKSFASLLWNGPRGINEEWITKKALAELPSEGRLSKSPAIVALREKLTAPPKDAAARKDLKAAAQNLR